MRSLQAELLAEGHQVSLSKLCGWLGVPRRSIYYKPKARPRIADPALTERVKLAMQRFPTYGYRRLAIVLGENKKPIQRILQIKGWQVVNANPVCPFFISLKCPVPIGIPRG